VTWTFGAEPLAQTRDAAVLLRQITGELLALEHDSADVDGVLVQLRQIEATLHHLIPPGSTPRVGEAAAGDGRVYIDHSRSIGGYNPSFPEYDIVVEGERAWGTVTFPVPYEGPPGIVHGGFLALFFDCVVQHHNCDVGVAGRTTSLTLRYRRPVPLTTDLDFTVARSVSGGLIHSTAKLVSQGRVLCEAEVDAIAGDRAKLPTVAPRRDAS
jgi:acyl-coenzyme A thioesterase PaaI-like protein